MYVAAFIGEPQYYKIFKPSYLSFGKWAISPFLSDQVTYWFAIFILIFACYRYACYYFLTFVCSTYFVCTQLAYTCKVALGVLLNPVNKDFLEELEPYVIQVCV